MTTSADLTVLVDSLRRDRRRHPYSGRREYARAARDLAAGCERLIAQGNAADAAPLLRKAVDRMTKALMYLDDSSGAIGGDLAAIMSLYGRACAAAPPKPTALARWLVTLLYDGPGWPEVRLRDFEAALGERGLVEIAALVEARSANTDGPSGAEQPWGKTFATRTLREQLAEVSGDVDTYVNVLAENLHSAHQFRRIATALRSAGRAAEAIEWARRGLIAKERWPQADQLRDVLVDMLIQTGDPEAALAERRADFEHHPTARAYQSLVKTPDRCGPSQDDGAVRTWAITVLRERVAREPAFAGELLAVLLAEAKVADAWQVGVDHTGDLPEPVLLDLLDRRAESDPEDVVNPYRILIEQHLLDSRDKHRYKRAIALLARLSRVHERLGDTDGFAGYLDQLRVEHRRRPTFLAQLKAAGF